MSQFIATIMVILLIFVVATISFVFLRSFLKGEIKTENEDSHEEKDHSSAQRKSYCEMVFDLNKESRLNGVAQTSSIERLFDEMLKVASSLDEMAGDEKAKMMGVPATFERLLKKHLPDYIKRFEKVRHDPEKQEEFNETVNNLSGDMKEIKSGLEQRDYQSFKTKNRFMEARFNQEL